MPRWLSPGLVALALTMLAGCDDPPLGGTPPSSPARTWFASCPRLDGTYALARPEEGRYPWDKLTIQSDGDWAMRFTWRRADLSYTNADLGADPAQLARYRWSRGQDELADDDFAAHDSAGLVSAPASMRHVPGLGNVRVRRFSGTSASPQTLTVTADADASLR